MKILLNKYLLNTQKSSLIRQLQAKEIQPYHIYGEKLRNKIAGAVFTHFIATHRRETKQKI